MSAAFALHFDDTGTHFAHSLKSFSVPFLFSMLFHSLFLSHIVTHAAHIHNNHFLYTTKCVQLLLACAHSEMHLRQSSFCSMEEKKMLLHFVVHRIEMTKQKKTRVSLQFCYFLHAICVRLRMHVCAHYMCVMCVRIKFLYPLFDIITRF